MIEIALIIVAFYIILVTVSLVMSLSLFWTTELLEEFSSFFHRSKK